MIVKHPIVIAIAVSYAMLPYVSSGVGVPVVSGGHRFQIEKPREELDLVTTAVIVITLNRQGVNDRPASYF
jgi:hypothetical protein